MRTVVGAAVKLAVIAFGASIRIVNGFAVPLADPLHPVN